MFGCCFTVQGWHGLWFFCESWCTMKAARGPYKQGKALCDSLIKQRKCKLSLARRSSWQNWSFTRGSSQDVRLCSPHNTEKEGLFLTSSCFLFYNSTLSQLDALPGSRPGCLSVSQSVGRSQQYLNLAHVGSRKGQAAHSSVTVSTAHCEPHPS